MEDTIRGRVEDVQAGLEVLRVLVDSADCKICAMLREKKSADAYGELLWSNARDIQVLLSVATNYLFDLDQRQGAIISMLVDKQGATT